MISRIQNWFTDRKMLNIQQFAHAHKDYLVIVCDPKDDTIFVSFRDKQVTGKIKSMDGKNHKVVKNVLKHSVFEREIDRLLGALIDTLKTPIEWGNHFYQFVDAALYNISKTLKLEKNSK